MKTCVIAMMAVLAGILALTALHPVEAAEPATGDWLEQINSYRSMAGLEPVEVDPEASAADLNHARYLVKRFQVELPETVDVHDEGRDTPWSTPSGARAASLSDIAFRAGHQDSVDLAGQIKQVINDWMADPFERLPMLDPDLRKVGIGTYRENDFTAIVLQVRTPPPSPEEIAMGSPEDYRKRQTPAASSRYPLMFPPDGSTVPLAAYQGGGWPNPLAACGNYVGVTGLPITLELGTSVHDETIVSHTLASGTIALEHCIFTADTYVGFGDDQTIIGRRDLATYGAIVIIPRVSFHNGGQYTVTVKTDQHEYKWSFTVRLE
jgi:Cysteine-rich secretory protein family